VYQEPVASAGSGSGLAAGSDVSVKPGRKPVPVFACACCRVTAKAADAFSFAWNFADHGSGLTTPPQPLGTLPVLIVQRPRPDHAVRQESQCRSPRRRNSRRRSRRARTLCPHTSRLIRRSPRGSRGHHLGRRARCSSRRPELASRPASPLWYRWARAFASTSA